MKRRGGFTLLEAVVAVAVLGVGLLAAEQLLAQGVRTMGTERARLDAALLAQTLLADARLDPTGPQASRGTTPAGLAFERSVRRGPDPALVEVTVRTRRPGVRGSACELIEVMRATP